MFFLGWLALCFLVVGAINLYLRHFGLPKGRGQAGRVGVGGVGGTIGYGSVTFSGLGAKVGGSPFSGSAIGGGETGHWVNCILSWIYQTQSRVPDFVESWLTALTTEAEKQAKEMQVRFEGIHGSPPEFSHFRTELASTDKDFTILMTLILRDVTLQTSTMAKSSATKASQPVKCDVYLQNLTGQVKAVTKFSNNELCLHLSFITEPNIKLQIRPTRVDYVIDNTAFEKIVRAAISNATMRVDWTSRSTARPSNLRITEPNSVQRLTSDHQAHGLTSRTPPSKSSSPLHATFRDDSYNDDQSSAQRASKPFAGASSSPAGIFTQEQRQSPLSHSPQTVTFQGQQGQYPGHGQYPEATQSQQYPGTAQGHEHYQSASQDQHYPATGQGQQYPGQGQGQQYSNTGQGQPYPSQGQGQHYPGQGQGQQYSNTGQGQQYPNQSQGQQYPNTGQGQQYPSQGQGQQYPSQGQGQQYSSQGLDHQYPAMVEGQQPGITEGQTSPQTLSQGPKLFVKVVKANGLIDADFGNCSAFCRVHVDNPPQSFSTNVIRNTVNPCWDTQFISDLDPRTKQIQFEVIDRDRQPGSELLGKAVVLVDEIRRMPSSRQIIPLTGKPKSRTSTSGSVTVEFVFRDSLQDSSPSTSSGGSGVPFGLPQGAAAAALQKQTSVQGTSFSSSAQFTPVTGSGVNEPRSRRDVQSRAASSADYSPYSTQRSSGSTPAVPASGSTQLSAHNLALTSSQSVGSRPQDSPTVVVTGAESLQSSRPTSLTMEVTNNLETKKKESFANTLKRKLGRVKIKPRSQSADRTTSHSMREGSLLRPPPPGHGGATLQATPSQSTRNTDFPSDPGSAVGLGDDGTLRKTRSNSFGSSLRRIFRRDKKDPMSRESSLRNAPHSSSSSGHLGRGDGSSSREALTAAAARQGDDRSRRHNTPVPSGDRFATGGDTAADFTYSSSVPAVTSPLNNR